MSRPCLGTRTGHKRLAALESRVPWRVHSAGLLAGSGLAGRSFRRCSYELEKKAEGAEHDADGTEDDFGRVGRERLGREAEVDGGRHDE